MQKGRHKSVIKVKDIQYKMHQGQTNLPKTITGNFSADANIKAIKAYASLIDTPIHISRSPAKHQK